MAGAPAGSDSVRPNAMQGLSPCMSVRRMKSTSLQVGQFTFHWGSRTYVMGILNVTPDSFSGDGIIAKGDVVKIAVEQAGQFIESGADILDVGGESTRPGSAPVDAAQEMERVLPVIEAL